MEELCRAFHEEDITETVYMGAGERIKAARELKYLFDSLTPFIQRHTERVCPVCETVCCIDRHGRYDKEDKIFISALGIHIPAFIPDRKDTDPCQFLTSRGCSIERWQRPFRCTWYFCDALLESMKDDRGRPYRSFVHSLQKLVLIRQQLLK
jgi:hypothetical protein